MVEMDSIHSTRHLDVEPRGQVSRQIINDFFCANGESNLVVINKAVSSNPTTLNSISLDLLILSFEYC